MVESHAQITRSRSLTRELRSKTAQAVALRAEARMLCANPAPSDAKSPYRKRVVVFMADAARLRHFCAQLEAGGCETVAVSDFHAAEAELMSERRIDLLITDEPDPAEWNAESRTLH
jgi:hypothetical protein